MKSHVLRTHLRHALRLLRQVERIPLERDDGKDLMHCNFCGSGKSHYPDCELSVLLKSLDPLGCPKACLCEECILRLTGGEGIEGSPGSKASTNSVDG